MGMHLTRRQVIFGAASGMALLASGDARAENLNVAINTATRPFVFKAEDGTLSGFNVDIARAVCKAMKVTCNLVPIPFKDVIPAIETGQVDFAVSSMLKTPERDLRVDFTDHYWRSTSSFIGLAGAGLSVSAAGLKGKIIAVQSGTTQERWLHEKWPGIVDIRSYPRAEQRWEALANGEVELVLAPTLTAFEFLISTPGQKYDFIGPGMMQDNLGGEACLTLADGNVALKQRLNKALYAIRKDGEYDLISRRYFPISIY